MYIITATMNFGGSACYNNLNNNLIYFHQTSECTHRSEFSMLEHWPVVDTLCIWCKMCLICNPEVPDRCSLSLKAFNGFVLNVTENVLCLLCPSSVLPGHLLLCTWQWKLFTPKTFNGPFIPWPLLFNYHWIRMAQDSTVNIWHNKYPNSHFSNQIPAPQTRNQAFEYLNTHFEHRRRNAWFSFHLEFQAVQ